MPDVVIYPRNEEGKDYVIGPTRGNLGVLKSAMEKLGKKDRLFIAGDSVGDGKENMAVLSEILKYNSQFKHPRIVIVLGNHEERCLESVRRMEKIAEAIAQELYEKTPEVNPVVNPEVFHQRVFADQRLQEHIQKMGGEWLYELFKKEFFEHGNCFIGAEREVEYQEESNIGKIKELFSESAYVVRVAGDKDHEHYAPFNVVHEDNPLPDEQIMWMALGDRKGNQLSPMKRQHAVSAHENNLAPGVTGRTEYSALTISAHGHDVRAVVNALSIDLRKFKSNVRLVVNMKDRKAELVGEIRPDEQEQLNNIQKKINDRLENQKKYEKILLAECGKKESFVEVRDLLAKALDASRFNQFLIYLLNNNALGRFDIRDHDQLKNKLNELPPAPPRDRSAQSPLASLHPSNYSVKIFYREPESKEAENQLNKANSAKLTPSQ